MMMAVVPDNDESEAHFGDRLVSLSHTISYQPGNCSVDGLGRISRIRSIFLITA